MKISLCRDICCYEQEAQLSQRNSVSAVHVAQLMYDMQLIKFWIYTALYIVIGVNAYFNKNYADEHDC